MHVIRCPIYYCQQEETLPRFSVHSAFKKFPVYSWEKHRHVYIIAVLCKLAAITLK
uniref:Uncharacterized protein n=1 Tax=Picea sitchensis TaxID=3332 RepID=D5AD78_PICSI|nr:unknown [Picea sitchensis]